MDPLRIYVFNEGLTRFASEQYKQNVSQQDLKANRFVHLTNYSVNKKNSKFVYNERADQDNVGNKWSLSALCRHFEEVGIDLQLLWSRIYDVIIKAIVAVEGPIQA